MAVIGLNESDPSYDPSAGYDERNSGGFTGGSAPQQPDYSNIPGVSTTPGKPIALPSNPANPNVFPGYDALGVSPIPWAPGATQPSSAPQGWQWDANLATFVPATGGSASSPTSRTDTNYILGKIGEWSKLPGANPSLANDPNYWLRRILETGGLGSDNEAFWQGLGMRPEGAPENWTPSMGSNPANWTQQLNWGGGTSVFNDPATQQYEQMLNSLIGNLNQPYTPPSFGPSMDYLTKYFQQLQGPAYTPQQMDLLQTQSFDPIMQQRDAARQQILQRFARQGMGPDSGPVQAALLQNDQAYEKLGTQARAGVASNAIGLQKQQQAQAAQLGPLMASLEQQQFNNNQSRQLQAAQEASIIPSLAWQRLTGLNSSIQPINPGSLFQPLQNFQQQGYTQGANYMSQLMQVLTSLFGG